MEAALAAPASSKTRSKARCAVTNARGASGLWRRSGAALPATSGHWVDGVPVDHRLERPEDMPAEDGLSRRVSADLKSGASALGAGDCLSYLQGRGLINDHLVTCPGHGERDYNLQDCLQNKTDGAMMSL